MKNKMSFSKLLLLQESILIWIITLVFLVLAYQSINQGYVGNLPWLTALAGLPWASYSVSQSFYYNKSKAENTKDGIQYELAVNAAQIAQEIQGLADDYDTVGYLSVDEMEDMSGLSTPQI